MIKGNNLDSNVIHILTLIEIDYYRSMKVFKNGREEKTHHKVWVRLHGTTPNPRLLLANGSQFNAFVGEEFTLFASAPQNQILSLGEPPHATWIVAQCPILADLQGKKVKWRRRNLYDLFPLWHNTDRHHSVKSGNISITERHQIYLILVTWNSTDTKKICRRESILQEHALG